MSHDHRSCPISLRRPWYLKEGRPARAAQAAPRPMAKRPESHRISAGRARPDRPAQGVRTDEKVGPSREAVLATGSVDGLPRQADPGPAVSRLEAGALPPRMARAGGVQGRGKASELKADPGQAILMKMVTRNTNRVQPDVRVSLQIISRSLARMSCVSAIKRSGSLVGLCVASAPANGRRDSARTCRRRRAPPSGLVALCQRRTR